MKPFYSMRLGERHQWDHKLLTEYVEMFDRNPGSCDEVWFATYYGYPALEQHRWLAAKICEAAGYVREHGIAASLQVSNTIGHGEYNSIRDFSGFAWDDMVGPDGAHARYCACPRDPRFLDYFATITRDYASIHPDVVWIDDDLRMHHHHPVAYGCFCHRCVDTFNERFGTDYDRKSLVEAVNASGSSEKRDNLVEFNQDALLLVVGTIADAVMEISPESTVGVQQASFAWSSYSGGNFHALYAGIRERTGKPSACRPGGGYYNDHAPRSVLDKALNLAIQTDRMPEDMEISQAEIENIPHNVSGKSVRGTLIESALYLAYGCTSLSYSAFMIPNEAPSFYEALFDGLAEWRGFLVDYAEQCRGTAVAGAGIVLSETHRKLDMAGREAFAWASFGRSDIISLLTYGLPLTWRNDSTPVLLVHNEAVDGLSESEIREIFSQPVITDGQTVEKLKARGMGDVFDIDVEAFEDIRSIDRCTDHPLNGNYAGQSWYNFYTSSSPYPPLKLVPKDPDTEVIGEYVLRDDETQVTGVSSVLTTTSFGGRAAVFGYSLWSNLVNSAKRHQILNVADHISANAMPVYLETPSQVAVIPRVDRDGRLVNVMLVNVSIDTCPKLKIELRKPAGRVAVWSVPPHSRRTLEARATDGALSVSVPEIPPWGLGVITLTEAENAP